MNSLFSGTPASCKRCSLLFANSRRLLLHYQTKHDEGDVSWPSCWLNYPSLRTKFLSYLANPQANLILADFGHCGRALRPGRLLAHRLAPEEATRLHGSLGSLNSISAHHHHAHAGLRAHIRGRLPCAAAAAAGGCRSSGSGGQSAGAAAGAPRGDGQDAHDAADGCSPSGRCCTCCPAAAAASAADAAALRAVRLAQAGALLARVGWIVVDQRGSTPRALQAGASRHLWNGKVQMISAFNKLILSRPTPSPSGLPPRNLSPT